MSEEEKEEKFDVRVIVSSLGNERRTISFRENEKPEVQKIIETVSSAFNAIKTNESLLLTGSDGVVVIINTKNVAFVEVHIAKA